MSESKKLNKEEKKKESWNSEEESYFESRTHQVGKMAERVRNRS